MTQAVQLFHTTEVKNLTIVHIAIRLNDLVSLEDYERGSSAIQNLGSCEYAGT